VIPLFPELRQYLEEAWEPGAEFVITLRRDAKTNLRTRFEKIIRRSGLEPWPKLFANLRSTRETELAESFPLHVVCQWIGNSQPVALKHYLQVTDYHFARALGDGAQAAQNAARRSGEMDCTGVRSEKSDEPVAGEESQNLAGNQADAVLCTIGGGQVDDEGLEPPTPSV
jgi:hypothetical protein